MNVSAIATNGLHQAEAGFQKAASQLSNTADAEDSVSLSDAVVGLIQNRNEYSANIQTLKVADQMEKEAIDIIG